jgi:hypothetical protein
MPDRDDPEQLVGEIARGRCSAAVRDTLEKALRLLRPELTARPSIDSRFVLWLLRKQTEIAVLSSSPKVVQSWTRFLTALENLEATYFDYPSLPRVRRGLRAARQEVQRAHGRFTDLPETRLAEDIYNRQQSQFGEFRRQVENLRAECDLPHLSTENPRRGGRPDSQETDAIALLLSERFIDERTGRARWTLVSQLLNCAPKIPGLLCDAQHIRQRVDQGRRKGRARVRHTMSLPDRANELKREFYGPTHLEPVLRERVDAMRIHAESLNAAKRAGPA